MEEVTLPLEVNGIWDSDDEDVYATSEPAYHTMLEEEDKEVAKIISQSPPKDNKVQVLTRTGRLNAAQGQNNV